MIRQELVTELRKKLEAQREQGLARIAELEASDPFNLTTNTDIDDDRTSPDDEAALNEQHERTQTQIDSQKKILVKIDSALERMDNGKYGVCEVCGKDIEESRLMAMPLAAMCLQDEKSNEQRAKKRV